MRSDLETLIGLKQVINKFSETFWNCMLTDAYFTRVESYGRKFKI